MKRIASFLIALAIICLIVSLSYATDKGNTRFQSFSKVKKVLLRQVYSDHLTTFYCNCPFTMDKTIVPSDKYTPKKEGNRANRVEWEHIVPAHAFGQSFPEWRNGHPECVSSKGKPFKGRNCARKMVVKFRYMESDMYNLVPAVGEINGLRSNYSFGMIPGEKREFGNCDMEIENRKAEPPPEKRGNIARTYFYMDWAYPGHGIISKKNRKLFEAWSKEDPVDAWECERCKRIEKIQGNENLFVKEPCQAVGLW
ncbi:MAG: endonuclease [Syntrophales bacterium]|nr:endonuclease [Syntrophales bacterium]